MIISLKTREVHSSQLSFLANHFYEIQYCIRVGIPAQTQWRCLLVWNTVFQLYCLYNCTHHKITKYDWNTVKWKERTQSMLMLHSLKIFKWHSAEKTSSCSHSYPQLGRIITVFLRVTIDPDFFELVLSFPFL